MELKSFISQTISEIISGLNDASILTKKDIGLYSTGEHNQRHIEFDVAVTSGNKKGKESSINVLWFYHANSKNKSESTNMSVSRIKFGIRIKDSKK